MSIIGHYYCTQHISISGVGHFVVAAGWEEPQAGPQVTPVDGGVPGSLSFTWGGKPVN